MTCGTHSDQNKSQRIGKWRKRLILNAGHLSFHFALICWKGSCQTKAQLMDLLAKELCAAILTTVLIAHGAYFSKVGHSRRFCEAQSSFSLHFISLKMSFRLHWCTSVRKRNDIVEGKGAMKDYIWRQQLMITACYKRVGEWGRYERRKIDVIKLLLLSFDLCALLWL